MSALHLRWRVGTSVVGACFEQQHRDRGVLAQTTRQHRARRTRADDHVIPMPRHLKPPIHLDR